MNLSSAIGVFFLCWISVLRADDSINLSKCTRDDENCEQFSFRRIQQNISNVNGSDSKNLRSRPFNNDLVENQIVLAQAFNEENGNFHTFACYYSNEFI